MAGFLQSTMLQLPISSGEETKTKFTDSRDLGSERSAGADSRRSPWGAHWRRDLRNTLQMCVQIRRPWRQPDGLPRSRPAAYRPPLSRITAGASEAGAARPPGRAAASAGSTPAVNRACSRLARSPASGSLQPENSGAAAAGETPTSRARAALLRRIADRCARPDGMLPCPDCCETASARPRVGRFPGRSVPRNASCDTPARRAVRTTSSARQPTAHGDRSKEDWTGSLRRAGGRIRS